jgi:hypothetical protein
MTTAVEAIGRISSWRGDSGQFPIETTFFSPVDHVRGYEARLAGHWMTYPTPEPTPFTTEETQAKSIVIQTVAKEEPQWLPWAFEPIPAHHWVVSSMGLGAIASGITLSPAEGNARAATLVLPARDVLRIINPGQLTIRTTALHEVGTIDLVTPGLKSRSLRVQEAISPWYLESPWGDPSATDALSAVGDVSRWLGRSRDEVADICHYSLRASQYWATGKQPRPSTVRRLFEVHAFAGSLVERLGRRRARQWLEDRPDGGASRLEALAASDSIASFIREASPMLFAEPTLGEGPRSEAAEAEEISRVAEPYDPSRFRHANPRRGRRLPPRS